MRNLTVLSSPRLRTMRALVCVIASGCGAKTELLSDTPISTATPAPEPPGCVWNSGPAHAITTTEANASANNVGESGVGPDGLVFSWNSNDPLAGPDSTLRWRSAQVALDGTQRGPVRELATVRTSLGLAVIGPPEVISTDSGYAGVYWAGMGGCVLQRMDRDGAPLGALTGFAPAGFCEDLSALDAGALRVFVGARMIGGVSAPFIHLSSFVRVEANNTFSAPTRADSTVVLARATFRDATSVVFGVETRGTFPAGLFAQRTDASSRAVGDRVSLAPVELNRAVSLLHARTTASGGAVASWIDPTRSTVLPTSAGFAVFSRAGALALPGALALDGPENSAVTALSVDATATRLFATWAARNGTTNTTVILSRVFDLRGTAVSPLIEVTRTQSSGSARMRATAEGAIVYGGARASNEVAWAAALRCTTGG
jgi:hypothetical protein